MRYLLEALRQPHPLRTIRRGLSRLPMRVRAMAAIALAIIWMAAVQQTLVDRQTTLEAGRRDGESYAVAFAEFTKRTLQAADRALRAMQQDYAEDGKVDAPNLVQSGLVPTDPSVLYGWFDEQGFLLSSTSATPAGVNSATRSWFQALKASNEDILYIDTPQMGRQTARTVIVVGRRLVHADGSFAGAVAISFPPSYLVDFNPGTRYHRTALSIVGKDGTYFARRVGDDVRVPTDRKAEYVAEALRTSPSGIVENASPVDGLMRVGAYRYLPEYGLTVLVAQSMDDILAGYYGRRSTVLVAAALASLLVLILFALLGSWILQERDLREQQRESEAKSTFLATLAHELRNPLGAVRNSARVLTLSDEKVQLANARWAGEVIERQVAHMSRLLDDLLDVTRITRNTLELKRAPVSVDDIVEAAQEQVRDVLADAQQQLVLEPAPGTLIVNGDRVRLVQVLVNLLHNAAKYSRGPGEVHLVVRQEGKEAVIAVSDHGIGIPAEQLPRIFRLFVQTPGGKARAQGGLGIGLSLVKGVVELHGGSVSVASPGEGLGATFQVRLPLLAVQSIEELPAAPWHDHRSAGPTRVLIVEDNHDAANSLALVLRSHGYTVEVCYNGAEFRRLNPVFAPDVALLDIGLPDTTGYQLAKEVRAAGSHQRLIALTGWGQSEDRARAKEAGFDQHLTKPVEIDALLPLLGQDRPPPALHIVSE